MRNPVSAAAKAGRDRSAVAQRCRRERRAHSEVRWFATPVVVERQREVPHDLDNYYSWSAGGTAADGDAFTNFLDDLNSTGFAGQHDWRLPTLFELQTIVATDAVPCGNRSLRRRSALLAHAVARLLIVLDVPGLSDARVGRVLLQRGHVQRLQQDEQPLRSWCSCRLLTRSLDHSIFDHFVFGIVGTTNPQFPVVSPIGHDGGKFRRPYTANLRTLRSRSIAA